MAGVSLRELTDANRAAVVGLAVAPAQVQFVGSVAGALEDAAEFPEANPWYRGIYAGPAPVGFVMLSWDCTPDPPRIIGPWFLWKLIVDERHQGRGYGRAAVRLVADLVSAAGASELLTSYAEGDGDPWPFYRSVGFRPTGELDEVGEIILSLDLSDAPSPAPG